MRRASRRPRGSRPPAAPGSRRESGLTAQFIAVFTGRGIYCAAMPRKDRGRRGLAVRPVRLRRSRAGRASRSRRGQGSLRRSAACRRIRAYEAMQQRIQPEPPGGGRRLPPGQAAGGMTPGGSHVRLEGTRARHHDAAAKSGDPLAGYPPGVAATVRLGISWLARDPQPAHLLTRIGGDRWFTVGGWQSGTCDEAAEHAMAVRRLNAKRWWLFTDLVPGSQQPAMARRAGLP